MPICLHTRIQAYQHTCIQICTHACIRTYEYACMCAYTYIHMLACSIYRNYKILSNHQQLRISFQFLDLYRSITISNCFFSSLVICTEEYSSIIISINSSIVSALFKLTKAFNLSLVDFLTRTLVTFFSGGTSFFFTGCLGSSVTVDSTSSSLNEVEGVI